MNRPTDLIFFHLGDWKQECFLLRPYHKFSVGIKFVQTYDNSFCVISSRVTGLANYTPLIIGDAHTPALVCGALWFSQLQHSSTMINGLDVSSTRSEQRRRFWLSRSKYFKKKVVCPLSKQETQMSSSYMCSKKKVKIKTAQSSRGENSLPPPSFDCRSCQPWSPQVSFHARFVVFGLFIVKPLNRSLLLANIPEACLFSTRPLLNQTFLRDAGGLAKSPCRWRINRPSVELVHVVDSFQLYFGHESNHSSYFPDHFRNEILINEMQVHIRLVCTRHILRACTNSVESSYACPFIRRKKFTNPTRCLFLFSKVPGAPAMALDSGKASIIVTVNDDQYPSYYNRKEGCARLNFKTTFCAAGKRSIIFSGLEEYTNYTIEGWIVNGPGEAGQRTTIVFATKPDSEYVM